MNKDVTNYLKAQSPIQRKVLEHMYDVVMATIPNTESKISYGIIGFTYCGKVPFFISGWKNHVSIHGGRMLGKKAQELFPDLKVVGTTIQIDPDKPLSDAKLKKIIKLRISIFDESAGRM
ncbi:MAG: iron chaperone [Rhodoluna sp.]